MATEGSPRIGLLPIVKVREYTENVPSLVAEAETALRLAGAHVLTEPIAQDEQRAIEATADLKQKEVDLVLFLVGSWIEAPQVVTPARDLNLPFTVWSIVNIPNAALGGAAVVRYTLEEMGIDFDFVVGMPGEAETLARIMARARAAAVAKRLNQAKIGEIGGKSMGMYNATLDEYFWKAKIGVDLPHYDTYRVIKLLEEVDEAEVGLVMAQVVQRVGHIVREHPAGETLTDDDLRMQCRLFLALAQLTREEGLAALGNKCQPELASNKRGLGCTACLAHALLIDHGVMCSCEADMPAAITMLLLKLLSGGAVFFGDLNTIDRARNTVRFVNCGSGPLSLAKNQEETVLWPVPPLMGYPGLARGATTSFTLRPGRVTVAKLGGGKGTARIHHTTGFTLDCVTEPKGMHPERFPQALISLDTDLENFLQRVIGQHYIVAYGDWTRELRELCRIWGIASVT